MKNISIVILLLVNALGVAAQRQPDPKLTALLNEKDSIVLQNKLEALGKTDNEDDISLVLQYYNRINISPKADSVYRLAQKKFPKGKYSFIAAGNIVTTEQDPKEKQRLYDNLVKDFPGRDYSMQEYGLASQYVEAGDNKRMYKYLNKMGDKNFQLEAHVILGQQLLEKGDYKTAQKLIKVGLDSASKWILNFDSAKVRVASINPMGARGNPQGAYNRFATAYSRVLLKMGKKEEAYQYSKEAYDHSNKRNAEINGQYITTLLATNRLKEAMPVMETELKEGRAAEEVKNRLPDAYAAVNGTGKGYLEYKAALDNEIKMKIKADVAKMIIKEHANDFTLTDVNGKTVSLHDLKGKVVILDFWATWCGPCKRSFPAMQMAINKYKDDPNVKFLFIHTWERDGVDASAAAKKYVDDNKFTFQVLMDKKDPETLTNKVVTDYKILVIPAKFIIDGNGDIRFKLSGFSGGNDAAVEELSAMIELAQAK